MVGGGKVAERRVHALLGAGAALVVVAPRLTATLERLAGKRKIDWVRRAYRPGDLRGALLAFALTDDPEVNRGVAREATALGIWVNLASDPDASAFHVPALLGQGEVQVAISTGGASPLLAAHLRERLSSQVDSAYGFMAEILGELRSALKEAGIGARDRVRILSLLVESDLLGLIRARPEGARRGIGWKEINARVRELSGLSSFSYRGNSGRDARVEEDK